MQLEQSKEKGKVLESWARGCCRELGLLWGVCSTLSLHPNHSLRGSTPLSFAGPWHSRGRAAGLEAGRAQGQGSAMH